jgi:putative hemin transport protein
MISINATLEERYQQLKAAQPQLRIRDAAEQLGVSELALLELDLGRGVLRLRENWKALLKSFATLDKVMALTRNDYVVHERSGIYDNVSFRRNSSVGVALNEDIDLRFFLDAWAHGYATRVETRKGPLYGFQFFDMYGEAVHKVYLTNQSDPRVYQKIVDRFRADHQQPLETILAREASEAPGPLPNIDGDAFQREWRALQDTHDFFPLLKKYGLHRSHALRMAPEGYAWRLGKEGVIKAFHEAAERALPIMIFVGSRGCIQIHTGRIERLVPMNDWFNIMDPDFNLHLRLDGLAETWVTRKPTKDGVVTGIEVFSPSGELILQVFGKRKPGLPEMETWRDIVARLK